MRTELYLVAWMMVVGCGGASSGAQAREVVICPVGSMLDPQKAVCVAMEPTKPIDVDTHVEVQAVATSTAVVIASATGVTPPPPPPPPPPPTSGFAVDVSCSFPQGWVALLPVGKYPKDDQFLMQSLIGLTKEPAFWTGLPEYRGLQPWAAKRCNQASGSSVATRLLAPTAGDYYLLAGQEGTFSLRGSYDKNGVRRKITVNANQSVTLAPADLTFTWLCISCPWIVFRSESGRDLQPFVVLANRRGITARGTDVHRVVHVPVTGGRVVLRVMEVEEEDTHLESLVVRVDGHALRAESHAAVELRPHTEVTLTYDVPEGAAQLVDVEVEATGYYDLR